MPSGIGAFDQYLTDFGVELGCKYGCKIKTWLRWSFTEPTASSWGHNSTRSVGSPSHPSLSLRWCLVCFGIHICSGSLTPVGLVQTPGSGETFGGSGTLGTSEKNRSVDAWIWTTSGWETDGGISQPWSETGLQRILCWGKSILGEEINIYNTVGIYPTVR